MTTPRPVPDVDFGNASSNVSAGLHAALQNTQPITCSFPQLSGESRWDALDRHIKENSDEAPKHLCDGCGRGFHRKDKLKIHLKSCFAINVGSEPHTHKAGPPPIATTSGPSMPVNEGANSLANYPFPCVVSGCDRVGYNGFSELGGQHGLIEHLRTVHESGVQSHGVNNARNRELVSQCLNSEAGFRLRQLFDEHQTHWLNNVSQFDEQDGTSQSGSAPQHY